jgi:hypothetical protein
LPRCFCCYLPRIISYRSPREGNAGQACYKGTVSVGTDFTGVFSVPAG